MIVNKLAPWTCMIGIQLLGGVVAPMLIIWNNNGVKDYLKRTIYNRALGAVQCFKTIWEPFKLPRRSTMVDPIT